MSVIETLLYIINIHDESNNYRIPTDLEKRKQWLDEMQLNDSEIPKNANFCSLYFEKTDLDRTSLACVRVKPGAFPHVCIN